MTWALESHRRLERLARHRKAFLDGLEMGFAGTIAGAISGAVLAGVGNGPVDGRGWQDQNGDWNWIDDQDRHCVHTCNPAGTVVSSSVPAGCVKITICNPMDVNTIRQYIEPGFHNIKPSGPKAPTPYGGSGIRQVTGHPNDDDDRQSPATSS